MELRTSCSGQNVTHQISHKWKPIGKCRSKSIGQFQYNPLDKCLEGTKGSQGMGVVSSNWFDRVLLSILCMFRSSCWPMFKPPVLGTPLVPLESEMMKLCTSCALLGLRSHPGSSWSRYHVQQVVTAGVVGGKVFFETRLKHLRFAIRLVVSSRRHPKPWTPSPRPAPRRATAWPASSPATRPSAATSAGSTCPRPARYCKYDLSCLWNSIHNPSPDPSHTHSTTMCIYIYIYKHMYIYIYIYIYIYRERERERERERDISSHTIPFYEHNSCTIATFAGSTCPRPPLGPRASREASKFIDSFRFRTSSEIPRSGSVRFGSAPSLGGAQAPLLPFLYLRLSYSRFRSLDFERRHLKIVVNTSRDRLLI